MNKMKKVRPIFGLSASGITAVPLKKQKKEAMNRVREELTRQFGRASGIVAEIQSDDKKGNIVVDVTQVDTSSVHSANND